MKPPPCIHRWAVMYPNIGGVVRPELGCVRRCGVRIPIAQAWECGGHILRDVATFDGVDAAERLATEIADAWTLWSVAVKGRSTP